MAESAATTVETVALMAYAGPNADRYFAELVVP